MYKMINTLCCNILVTSTSSSHALAQALRSALTYSNRISKLSHDFCVVVGGGVAVAAVVVVVVVAVTVVVVVQNNRLNCYVSAPRWYDFPPPSVPVPYIF